MLQSSIMLLRQTIVINKVITKVIAEYSFLAKVSFLPRSHYLHYDQVNCIMFAFTHQVERKATNPKSVIHLHQAQVLPTSSHANFIIIITKWTSIEERSRVYAILLHDLMKRGVCTCWVELLQLHPCLVCDPAN